VGDSKDSVRRARKKLWLSAQRRFDAGMWAFWRELEYRAKRTGREMPTTICLSDCAKINRYALRVPHEAIPRPSTCKANHRAEEASST
jgi:hypothetical protein